MFDAYVMGVCSWSSLPVGEFAGRLRARQFFAIVLLFWSYVTVSAVLYAYSMGSTLAAFTQEAVFAPWQSRVLQHVLLLPLLLVCYAASLRLDWKPLWWKLPLQAALGLGFALLARPAILVSQTLLSDKAVSRGQWDDPLTLAFEISGRLASGTQRGPFRLRTELTSTGKMQISGR